MKNLLIVNTLPKFALEAQSAIQMMQDKMPEVQVISRLREKPASLHWYREEL